VSSGTAPVRELTGTRSSLWAGWAISRAVTLLVLIHERLVYGDVRYYFHQVDALVNGGSIHGLLPEYPVPAVAALLLVRLLSGPWVHVYLGLFTVLMLAVDAALGRALFRAAEWRWLPGVVLWIAAMPLLGPILLCRFDLLPAALAGGALLTAARRPIASGVLAGLGTAAKLWPAALLPSLWLAAGRGGGEHRARTRLLASFAGLLAGVIVVVALTAGVDRLTSPLHWQGERGLQVEAYAAVPLLVADLFRPDRWHVEYTRYYAFQVVGPGVDTAITLASVATVLAIALLAALWLRTLRRGLGAQVVPVAGLLGTLTVILLTITDKTLSPQYLIWVAALLAVVGVTHPAALPRAAVPVLLAACAITHLVFPLNYDQLVAGRLYAVLLLVARDVCLAALGWLIGRRIWVLTREERAG
jgi:hypothetical protein